MKNQLQLLQNLKRAIYLLWQSTPIWTTVSLILLIIQGLLPLLFLYLMELIIDAVTAGIGAETTAYFQVILLILVTGVTALFSDLWCSLSNYAGEAQSQIFTDFVHDILHANSIKLDLEYYENSQFYNALHRAKQEAIYRPNRFTPQEDELARCQVLRVAGNR